MPSMMTTRIGENRGSKRIWLQGAILRHGGIDVGKPYAVHDHGHRLVLELKHGGPRRVSRKKRRAGYVPLIEIKSKDLQLGEVGTQLKVTIERGRLIIEVHPDEQDRLRRVARMHDKIRNNRPLSLGGICSGIGVIEEGIHAGLEREGLRTHHAFSVEHDPKIMDAAITNNPRWDASSKAICASIEDIRHGDIPEVDGLVVTLPCVGYSKLGRAKNRTAPEAHATAGHLFVSYLHMLPLANPAIVWFENVVDAKDSMSMDIVRTVMRKLNYELYETVIDGNSMGALDRRRRFVMVGVTRGLDVHLDLRDLVPVAEKPEHLKDVLDPVPLDDPRWREHAYLESKIARNQATGQNFQFWKLTGEEDTVYTLTANYWKRQTGQPFLQHPENPKLQRIFTKAEHARLKTVPEHLVAGLSETLGHTVLGNSGIYVAFEAVGAWVARALKRATDNARFGARRTEAQPLIEQLALT